MLDAFNTDAFSLVSLTAAIDKLPFQPTRLEELGLFTPKPISTLYAIVEERDGLLYLLPTRPRGADPSVASGAKRTARSFAVPHIPHADTIMASDIVGVRAFGTEDQQQVLAQIVNDRLEAMKQRHMYTREHLMMGALQGLIKDADGSTLFNLFTEFSKSEKTVDFAFTTATTAIRILVLEVIRYIELTLGALTYEHIHCFCGADWFDALIDHATVRDAYARWQNGEALRNDPRRAFVYGNVTFEEYPGTTGTQPFIAKDEARFFPVGVRNLFVTAFAPGDFIQAAGTMGQPIYAHQETMKHDRGIDLLTESNPFPVCCIPEVCTKGSMS